MLARLDYGYLKAAYLSLRAQQPSVLSTAPAIPDTVEALEGQGDDSALLRAVHFALCGIAVKKGALVCDACKTEYPIADYMLSHTRGWTAAHVAASHGHVEAMRMLLECDIDAMSLADDSSIVDWAAVEGEVAATSFALACGSQFASPFCNFF